MSTPVIDAPENTAKHLDTRTQRSNVGSLAMRLAGVAALGGIVWVHALDLSGKLEEVPYLGVGYILLIIGAVACAMALLVPNPRLNRAGWAFGGMLALGTMIGFTLTRTTGLPQATDDKGNWGEALGVWSLICEGVFVMLSVVALRSQRQVRAAIA